MEDSQQGRRVSGEAFAVPKHDNDNWRLFDDWITPAEFMQWVRRRKEGLRRELAADFRLRSCPENRLTWDIAEAMERCGRQHYYRDKG
jgi:hypothetical protein